MSTPFLTEIKMVSFNFAPKGWVLCNGQLLPINQNQAIFSLLGTTYGGNGQTTFGLPNFQGRVAVHSGGGYIIGQNAGEENHTLIQSELPAHTHQAQAVSAAGDAFNPLNHYPANSSPTQAYSGGGGGMQAVAMSPNMVTNAGGSQSHPNMMPYVVLNFIIALQGIFPSRN